MADGPIKFLANGQPDGRGQSEGSKAGQFASGDGRKRPGRRRGSPDERTLVLALLNMRVGTGRGGKRKYLREGILLAHAQKALKGDPKSTEYLQKLTDRYEVLATDNDRTARLLAEDQLILDSLKARGIVPPSGDPETSDRGGA